MPSPRTSEAVIETFNLGRTFGDIVALSDASFRINKGEVFGLIGPNGAGKSTLVKVLTTLLPPSSGRALVAGFDIAGEAAKVRKHIGYVPQVRSADGELTGYQNLLLSARLYLIPKAQRAKAIDTALQMMRLSEVRDRLVRDYSGGMVRRLEIAQSTIHRPAVVFMDEPTVGLDPSGRRAVWDHVRALQQELNEAIVLTTHYMDEAEELCDRVAVIHGGRIVAVGAPVELRASLGPAATLDDVFESLTGAKIRSEGKLP